MGKSVFARLINGQDLAVLVWHMLVASIQCYHQWLCCQTDTVNAAFSLLLGALCLFWIDSLSPEKSSYTQTSLFLLFPWSHSIPSDIAPAVGQHASIYANHHTKECWCHSFLNLSSGLVCSNRINMKPGKLKLVQSAFPCSGWGKNFQSNICCTLNDTTSKQRNGSVKANSHGYNDLRS